jgi:hypothetical protein
MSDPDASTSSGLDINGIEAHGKFMNQSKRPLLNQGSGNGSGKWNQNINALKMLHDLMARTRENLVARQQRFHRIP